MNFLIFTFVCQFLLNSFLEPTDINWNNIDHLERMVERGDRPVVLRLFAEWCEPCKKLRQSFDSNEFVETLGQQFHFVELEVQTERNIEFKGKSYNFTEGRKMNFNELALQFMEDEISFPMVIVLDKDWSELYKFRGYRAPEELVNQLRPYIKAK